MLIMLTILLNEGIVYNENIETSERK